MQRGLAAVVLSEMILKLTVAVVKQATLRGRRGQTWDQVVAALRVQCDALVDEQVGNYNSALRQRWPDLPESVLAEEADQVRAKLRECFADLVRAHVV